MNERDEHSRSQDIPSQLKRRNVLKGIGIATAGLVGTAGTALGSGDEGLTNSEEKRVRRLIRKAEKAKNPDRVVAEMTQEERELVQKAVRVREVQVDRAVETSTGDGSNGVSINAVCTTVTTTLTGASYLGDQWGYIIETDFCYDGSNVTRANWRRYGEVYGAFWHFDGHIDLDERGQVGTDYYQVWTQGEFHSSGGGFEFDHAYPWIEQTFHGDGSYNGDGNHGECSNC